MDAPKKLTSLVEKEIESLMHDKPQLDREGARAALEMHFERKIYRLMKVDPCCADIRFDLLEKQKGEIGQYARLRRVLMDMRPQTFNEAAWEVAGVLAGAE